MKAELDALGFGLIFPEPIVIYSGSPKEFSYQNASISKFDPNFAFLNSYSGSVEKEGLDNATVENIVETQSFDEIYHLIKGFTPLPDKTLESAARPLSKLKKDLKL